MAGIFNLDLSGAFNLIDKIHTSDDERNAAKIKAMELAQRGDLAQMAVNQTEAKHKSVFVAGWRPFIGWVCGIGLAWSAVVLPLLHFLVWVLAAYTSINVDPSLLPEVNTELLYGTMAGMLGIGATRAYEKRHGVASNSMME